MVIIHTEQGDKITVTCMGEAADKCSTVNQAMISRMNINKQMVECPIPSTVTATEHYIDVLVGAEVLREQNEKFDWYKYPDTTLRSLLKMDEIMNITSLLVDHVPEQLLGTFAKSVRQIPVNMSDDELTKMIESTGVMQLDEREDYTAETMSSYHAETVSAQNTTQTTTALSPFMHIEQDETGQQTTTGDATTNTGTNTRKYEGPFGLEGRSQLGQSLDLMGRSVSHQVIIDESFREQVQQMQSDRWNSPRGRLT
ncbi:hypothetical protein AYL99_11996 [Fonsecaea erecta]|uniref:Uncharacterized protein n=1 Tax=Fonsecaea erecta TaxID=1367422 RepID=A0A178Z1X8_9EURO|nr:hypothetical protein AYL99_11996 [Fonsecaea erecta]OAP53810.1 hypothetical protein AYL99_11996 [Fonsecaea erecta]